MDGAGGTFCRGVWKGGRQGWAGMQGIIVSSRRAGISSQSLASAVAVSVVQSCQISMSRDRWDQRSPAVRPGPVHSCIWPLEHPQEGTYVLPIHPSTPIPRIDEIRFTFWVEGGHRGNQWRQGTAQASMREGCWSRGNNRARQTRETGSRIITGVDLAGLRYQMWGMKVQWWKQWQFPVSSLCE